MNISAHWDKFNLNVVLNAIYPGENNIEKFIKLQKFIEDFKQMKSGKIKFNEFFDHYVHININKTNLTKFIND